MDNLTLALTLGSLTVMTLLIVVGEALRSGAEFEKDMEELSSGRRFDG